MEMRTTAIAKLFKIHDLGIPRGWNSERSSLARYSYIYAKIISSLVQDRYLVYLAFMAK
jgi:hypothetical protein